MAGSEIYSPEGLREDGRRWNELRHFKCNINTHPKSADGSSVVEMGSTKVVCLVHGPQEPAGRSKSKATATITVNVSVAPFATTDREKRTSNDRRLQELALNLQKTFEEAVLTHLNPRTEILVYITVLMQDGGVLPACVNAMTLALVDAGIPIYEYVSACSVALYGVSPLLDPNDAEERELPSATGAILGTSDKLLMLIIDRRLQLDQLDTALELGVAGCQVVRDMLDKEVRRHGDSRLKLQSGIL